MSETDLNSQTKRKARRPRLRWIVIALLVAALVATALRAWVNAHQSTAVRGTAWDVHLEYRLKAAQPGAELSLATPLDSKAQRLFKQELTLDGLQLRSTKGNHGGPRRLAMRATRAGEVAVDADFLVHRFEQRYRSRPSEASLSTEQRERDLSPESGIEVGGTVVRAALERINAPSDEMAGVVQRIYQYSHDKLVYRPKRGAETAVAALQTGRATGLGKARAMVALCRTAGVPARIVTGFVLAEQNPARPVHWVEVYEKDRWRPYDPKHGYEGQLPGGYAVFSRGAPLLETRNASITRVDYEVSEGDVPLSAAGGQRSIVDILDLSRLPLSARATLATLLLLPLGALLNAFVRSVVGVQTFGTFTPAMLALAAIYVDWLTAVVIFAVVGVIALFGRSRLPGLKLTRAPRLTIVFALVALAMALAISLMAQFDLLTGTQVVLLPIVILTSLVDRIYAVADEQGLHTASIRLLWTGITALGCFFILSSEALGDLLVSYPELHLITIALVLALSAYKGPQLRQFAPMRWLSTPAKTTDKGADAD